MRLQTRQGESVLGKETGKIVDAMTKFDPDKTWKKVE
jgi:hypothetical protein